MKRKLLFLLLFFLAGVVRAQSIGGGGEANPNLKTNFESLQNWQTMRFGMFIHWGPVTLRGTEIGWSRGREVPVKEYDNLYREFNPVLFDVKEWVAAAKAAGMKYLIITAKHHDGFCLWDSKYTDYDIMSTPFKRDVVKELAEECKLQGILFGTYYSIIDWHHPDYPIRHGDDPRQVEGSDMNRYIVYMKNQLRELIQNYNTNIIWFDGDWEKAWDHEKGMDLYRYVRELRNDILINNRVDKRLKSMHGMTASEKFAGDFGTPEQHIGAFDIDHPWESCITICQQWAWKPNDKLKSVRECIRTLVRAAGGGGNLLLNVGPMLDGRIEQRQIERLKQMGQWLAQYGESIYGTQGGPFKPSDWMVSTRKNNEIYLHLFAIQRKELLLPQFDNHKIISARVLHGQDLAITSEKGQISVQLPQKPIDENDTVIVLKFNRETSDIRALTIH